MTNKEINKDWLWIIVILALIIILILYLFSFGQLDITKKNSNLNLERRKKLAELRHRKLKSLIERKVKLKKILDRRFKLTYLTVRVFFVGILGALNWYYFGGNTNTSFGDIINFNETLCFAGFIIAFLAFGTIGNFESMLNYFKNILENWIYKKYLNIDNQIGKHIEESKELEQLINKYERRKIN